jgi:hypothetical protein
LADEKYQLLNTNPRHLSLHLKRVGRFWSCRVGLQHRTLGVDVEGGILWFWIVTPSMIGSSARLRLLVVASGIVLRMVKSHLTFHDIKSQRR